jgi:hypothetical protein
MTPPTRATTAGRAYLDLSSGRCCAKAHGVKTAFPRLIDTPYWR